jgi:hypothetical protein
MAKDRTTLQKQTVEIEQLRKEVEALRNEKAAMEKMQMELKEVERRNIRNETLAARYKEEADKAKAEWRDAQEALQFIKRFVTGLKTI